MYSAYIPISLTPRVLAEREREREREREDRRMSRGSERDGEKKLARWRQVRCETQRGGGNLQINTKYLKAHSTFSGGRDGRW